MTTFLKNQFVLIFFLAFGISVLWTVMPGLTSNEMATGYHKINGSNTLQDKITHSHKCLSSGSLSNLIDSTDQVIFTMPAKAGGTSMKRFAKACNDDSYKKLGDNSLNSHNQAE